MCLFHQTAGFFRVGSNPILSQFLTPQGAAQCMAWSYLLGPAPGIEYSVRLPCFAPISILTPESIPTSRPSPEGACAHESLTPPPLTQGHSQNPTGELLPAITPSHTRVGAPFPIPWEFRNSQVRRAPGRALSPGPGPERPWNLGQVAFSL